MKYKKITEVYNAQLLAPMQGIPSLTMTPGYFSLNCWINAAPTGAAAGKIC